MKSEDVAWLVGRPILGGSTAIATRLRSYGTDRIPHEPPAADVGSTGAQPAPAPTPMVKAPAAARRN